jgi:XTP/dITP diphosphohydrolase
VRVVLASANQAKFKELSQLLTPLGLVLTSMTELGIDSAEETATTFIENALIKARHASRKSGMAAIADDSGLAADALDGAPGVHSARYAGDNASDEDNNRKLLRALQQQQDRGLHYHCVIALLLHPDDPVPLIAAGRWDGQFTSEPRGSNGFGYDPYFYLPELDRTAAELEPPLKNQLSHRGQAVRRLAELLETRLIQPNPGH